MPENNPNSSADLQMRTRKIRTFSKNNALVKEKRELIANKALQLFLEKGYDGTAIREIAEACGIAEGAIYRYIGSKDDILHLYILTVGVNTIQNYLKELGEIGTVESLTKSIRRYYTWQDETAERNIFYNREINNFSPEDRKLLLSSQSDFIHFFEGLIVKGVAESMFQTSSPLLVAHNIVMLGFDWSLRKWFLRKYFTIDKYIDMQTEFFLRELIPHEIRERKKTVVLKIK